MTTPTRCIVLDIEGTITDINFVSQVLFPYARKHMPSFLADHHTDPRVIEQLNLVRQMENAPDLGLGQIITVLDTWMAEDRKAPPLKFLQGLLWRKGYETHEFQGHLYDEVVPQLEEWKRQGIALYIYSSGSVEAQKLLLGYSVKGDITPLFSGFFDTRIGAKTTEQAYQNLLSELKIPATSVTFYSDNPLELQSAVAVGLNVIEIQRDETKPLSANGNWPCQRHL